MRKTLSGIKESYWPEFMFWWAIDNNERYYNGADWVDYPLEEQFWKWLVRVKLQKATTVSSWEEL